MLDANTLARLKTQSEVADPDRLMDTVMHHWREAIEHILQVCGLLYFYRQRWGSRSDVWKETCRRLPFNMGTINKLCRIGSDERLFDPTIARHLPPHWGTLYEISSLSDKALHEGIGGEIITAEATRSQITSYKYEVGESAAVQKSNIRIREEWIDEYIARCFMIMDLPSRLPESEQKALEEHRQKRGGIEGVLDFLRDYKNSIPVIEQQISKMTDRLYTVRIRKNAGEKSVNEALRKFHELAEIDGVMPLNINRRALRAATNRELERTLSLADWIYEQFCIGEFKSALVLLETLDFIPRLKEYKVEHPLKSVVRYYLEHFGVEDTEIVTDETGQIDFTLIEDWEIIIRKLLSIEPKQWIDAPKPTSQMVASWDFNHGRRTGINKIPEFSTDHLERLRWEQPSFDEVDYVSWEMRILRNVKGQAWENWDADELEELHQSLDKEIQRRADAKAEFESQFEPSDKTE